MGFNSFKVKNIVFISEPGRTLWWRWARQEKVETWWSLQRSWYVAASTTGDQIDGKVKYVGDMWSFTTI